MEKRATATGELKDAAVPTPSSPPATPLPASVDTAPVPVPTRRTAWQERSAVKSAPPSPLRARLNTPFIVAAVPTPSAQPAAPLPARLYTAPPREMARIFSERAPVVDTYTHPKLGEVAFPSKATAAGAWNCATVAVAASRFAQVPVPANREVSPLGWMRRSLQLPESARMMPWGVTAAPRGRLKRVAVALPLA